MFYVSTRIWYIVISTKCYLVKDGQECFGHAKIINESTTVIICLSITLFLVVDLIKIRKCINGKDSKSEIQSSFKLNEVTVGILVTLILLQIVSTVMTLP